MKKQEPLTLQLLAGEYGVCRLKPEAVIPSWGIKSPFYSVTRTKDELSIICLESEIPSEVQCEHHWRIFKIIGPLDFSLIGILAPISELMAKHQISIFALSTYDTDYILVCDSKVVDAANALKSAGYHVIEE